VVEGESWYAAIETEGIMTYKRGNLYWIKFQHQGKMIYRSSGQTSKTKARAVEARIRSELALGHFGILETKTIPTLGEFIKNRFEPWASGRFPATSKTWSSWYKPGLRSIDSYTPLSGRALTDLTSEHIDGFAAHLSSKGLQPTSVNAQLRVLRSVLHKAKKWGVLAVVPDVAMLPGENHRDRVLTPDEESRYLAASNPLLSDVATVLVDTAMRPEESFRMRWEHINWDGGRYGTVLVTHGKTESARRIIPLTPRVRSILEARCNAAGRPEEGWVWPSQTQSGHIEPSTLKKQHAKALRLSKVRPFVLYTLRHTMLTRLGESGCDVWTLARIAGHSNIRISQRYVHPSDAHVLSALGQTGDKRRDSHATMDMGPSNEVPAIADTSVI
jgi:integrase